MIIFNNVSKQFEDDPSQGLRDVSFRITPNEFVYLIGSSGAGKSTIFNLIIGEKKSTKGTVIVDRQNISMASRGAITKLRRSIGYVFQDFKLLPKKTVEENIAFILEVMGYDKYEIGKRVTASLRLVGLSKKADNYPHELSGGERQRVAIARAVVHSPKIILADEPTGNLDNKISQGIIELLEKIHEADTTILVATHNLAMVNSYPHRSLLIEHGRLISDSTGRKFEEAFMPTVGESAQ